MKRRFKTYLIIILILVTAVIAIAIGSSRWLRVDEHTVYFDGLPSLSEGLRILHISDLHSNSQNRMNIDIWRHIDNLEFDIAVLTGDIISDALHLRSDPTAALNPHKEGLKALALRVPVFFVEGNHESRYYHLFKPAMEELGIIPLKNEYYFLESRGLYIVGTADYSLMRRANNFSGLDRLFEAGALGLPLRDENPPFRLVLTHQPQTFDRFKDSGPMFVLSGHTHGGQIRLPFLPVLYAPEQGFLPRYGCGLYYHGDSVMYVSSGIGTTYIFPFRFWNRPIVTILELRTTSKN
jgi:hypothetical protein